MPREPRTFAGLRGRAEVEPRTDLDDIDHVMRRLAGTRDGGLMLAWMRTEVQRGRPGATAEMLREENGVRVWVEKLIGFAEGRSEPG